MNRRHFRLGSEPRGASYETLLRNLAEFSSLVLVIVRDDLGLTDEANKLLAELSALGGSQLRTSQWPGTTLLGHEASVWSTPDTAASVDVVLRASGGLYSWQQPQLPEDLAFLRSDGSTVLGTVAHETDGWLELSDDEYSKVVTSCGALLDLVPEEGT
jgi:hypothetical protein